MTRVLVKLPVPRDVFDWLMDEIDRRGQGDRLMRVGRELLLSMDEIAIVRTEDAMWPPDNRRE